MEDGGSLPAIFFKQGPKSGYFEVRNTEASPASSDQFKAAKRELKAALRKAEEKETGNQRSPRAKSIVASSRMGSTFSRFRQDGIAGVD
jgi:hypothetical protein